MDAFLWDWAIGQVLLARAHRENVIDAVTYPDPARGGRWVVSVRRGTAAFVPDEPRTWIPDMTDAP